MVRSAGQLGARAAAGAAARSTRRRPGRPRPSLVCRCGSAPRGSRSASTRALIRRISRTSASSRPPVAGSAAGRSSATNRAPELRVAGHRLGPQQRLRLPDRATSARSRPRRTRACGPAGPCGPPAAGRRRRPAAGPATGSASSRRSSPTTACAASVASRSSAPVERVVHEQHVGVAAVAELAAAEAGPSRSTASRVGSGAAARSPRPRRTATSSAACERGRGDVGQRLARPARRRAARAGRPPRPGTARAGARARDRADGRRRVVVPAGRGQRPPRRAPPRPRGRSSASSASSRTRLRAPASAGRRRTGCVASSWASRSATGALVAQQPQVPVASCPSASLSLPEASRPRVGVGRVGEPAEQHRQQRALDRRPPARPRRSAPRGGAARRPGRRSRAPPAATAAASGRQPRLVRAEPGDRVEQRPVEQLLVQPADLAGVPRATPRSSSATGSVAQPERAAEPAQLGLVVGHEVGAPQPVQLQPVLDACAGTGRRGRARRRRRGRRSRRRQRLERRQRVAGCAATSSVRPCTSCSSWTANSTSRRPPRPELELAVGLRRPARAPRPGGASPARRRRSRSRSAACQTSGRERVDVRRARARGRRRPAGP